MKLVQVKFDEKLLAEIDTIVQEQEAINHSYNRSKFIREACKEKIKFADKYGRELIQAMKEYLEEKADNKDFQHLLLSIATAGATKALMNEQFNPAKALDGLDVGKLMGKLITIGKGEEEE